MAGKMTDADYYRHRAQAEIELAKAAGAAKAFASADNKTVFVERRDGTTEKVKLTRPKATH